MARTGWQPATLVDRQVETASAVTLGFELPSWPGHLAGQHLDVRLTADDGYRAQRSYSLATPADGARIAITVQRVADGEVSPYLTDLLAAGDQVEIRGPVGGWFVWRPTSTAPVLLVGGGSGVVPLMAMIRARRGAQSAVPFRLLYSVREPQDRLYADELRRPDPGLDVTFAYTRKAPEQARRPVGRVTAQDLTAHGWPADLTPDCFVCGPTGFVESVADQLVGLGHDPRRIRTERFGPTGGS